METTAFDFGTPVRDECPVTIRATRPMLVLRCGEASPRHLARGEAAAVPRWILGGMDPGDFDVVEVDPAGVDHSAL